MRSAVSVGVLVRAVILGFSSVMAQDARSERNAGLSALIQARIDSQQPARLSAESITMTGESLRLSGRARVRFDDTSIRADEIVIDQATKRVDLVGRVTAFLGSAFPRAVPPIEFR